MVPREELIFRQRAIHALDKLPLFSGISEEECLAVLGICRGVSFEANQIVFKERAASLALYVLLSGKVEVIAEGMRRTLRAGELFGEMGMICQIPRTATVVALEECAALKINKDEFDIFLGKFPRIGYILMKNIAETLSKRLLESRPRNASDLL